MLRFVLLSCLVLVSCSPSSAPARAAANASRTTSPSSSPAPLLTAQATATPRFTPFPTNAPFRYVSIGASDSVGVGASDPETKSWPAVLAHRMPPGTAHLNLGVSGSTVAQAIVEQLPDAASHPADVVTVWLAVNDLNRQVDVLAYRNDLARLLDTLIRSGGARIFIGTVPDLTKVPVYGSVDPTALAAAVTAYNAAIAEIVNVRRDRVTLVDLFTGSDTIARESVVAADGFHPNDRGYELIAERFANTMRTAGLPIR